MRSSISSNDVINLSSHVVRIPKSSIALINQYIFLNGNRDKYLDENSGNAAPLFLMTGIIDEIISSFDKLSQDIILDHWSGSGLKTLKKLSMKYACKEIDIFRVLKKCSDLKDFKFIIPLEEYLLEVICKTVKPLNFRDLFGSQVNKLTYHPNFYIGILATIYDHVPFAGHMHQKHHLLSTYKCVWNQKRKYHADTYDRLLESYILPFGEVTPEYLFDLLKVETAYERVVLLYYIFISLKYEFIKFNDQNILIRKGNLSQITRDILKNCEAPLESKKLIALLKKYYSKNISVRGLKTLVSKKDIIMFEGNRYGLKKHWQVRRN